MSVAVDPRFRKNRRVYLCHGGTLPSGRRDIRVSVWRLPAGDGRLRFRQRLVTGMPSSTGRHGGCRLEMGPGGRLWIGTGDAVIGTTPQSLRSLGGKVLRVDRFTGEGVPQNPWPNARNANRRRIFSYGHRNVQGLAFRPGQGMWSVEHGTYRDDEVNLLRRGGNYGWDPGPDYDESRPMTDCSLPGRQIGARWRCGEPTVATSGAVWLNHPRWRRWQGRLAVAALKDSSVRIMRFRDADLVSVRRPPALTKFGRLRSLTLAPNGTLVVTTSNGGGTDRVIRVVPSS